jgi:hypothetical protein
MKMKGGGKRMTMEDKQIRMKEMRSAELRK